jgi:hypothetical protein
MRDTSFLSGTEDAKACPDGSVLARDAGNDCKFATCPDVEQNGACTPGVPDYTKTAIYCDEPFVEQSCFCEQLRYTDPAVVPEEALGVG